MESTLRLQIDRNGFAIAAVWYMANDLHEGRGMARRLMIGQNRTVLPPLALVV